MNTRTLIFFRKNENRKTYMMKIRHLKFNFLPDFDPPYWSETRGIFSIFWCFDAHFSEKNENRKTYLMRIGQFKFNFLTDFDPPYWSETRGIFSIFWCFDGHFSKKNWEPKNIYDKNPTPQIELFNRFRPTLLVWNERYLKVVIPRTVCRVKKRFFGPPEVSFTSMAKPFEMRRLQMTSSKPPMSNFMLGQHVVNSCWLKVKKWPKKYLF